VHVQVSISPPAYPTGGSKGLLSLLNFFNIGMQQFKLLLTLLAYL
jgi:hypothetical protein